MIPPQFEWRAGFSRQRAALVNERLDARAGDTVSDMKRSWRGRVVRSARTSWWRSNWGGREGRGLPSVVRWQPDNDRSIMTSSTERVGRQAFEEPARVRAAGKAPRPTFPGR